MLSTCAGRILSGKAHLGLSADAALARGREQRLAAVVVRYCCLLGRWAAGVPGAWCCFQDSHGITQAVTPTLRRAAYTSTYEPYILVRAGDNG